MSIQELIRELLNIHSDRWQENIIATVEGDPEWELIAVEVDEEAVRLVIK